MKKKSILLVILGLTAISALSIVPRFVNANAEVKRYQKIPCIPGTTIQYSGWRCAFVAGTGDSCAPNTSQCL